MSGVNTKASKVDRAIRRIGEISEQSESIERLSNSLKLATETAARLEAENAKLRKYLGSELFARRQREMQIPTLDFTARSPCSCGPGQFDCRGYKNCRREAQTLKQIPLDAEIPC